MKETVINIADFFKGLLSPTELIKEEGSFQFAISGESLKKDKGYIVHIQHSKYFFAVVIINGEIQFQRNETTHCLNKEELLKFYKCNLLTVVAGWTPTTLFLGLFDFDKSGLIAGRDIPTRPTRPPVELIEYIKKSTLTPKDIYKDKEEFYERVFKVLGSLETKFQNISDPNIFWDIKYQGNKIIDRTPKRETNIHPIIKSILEDVFYISSIEVISEYQTPVGNVDFVLIGSTQKDGIIKVCVEFKNQHSKDILKGIQNQLPMYMNQLNTEFGCYCVLNYSGKWFDEKKQIDSMKLMGAVTSASYRAGKGDNQFTIQYFNYNLGKNKTASK